MDVTILYGSVQGATGERDGPAAKVLAAQRTRDAAAERLHHVRDRAARFALVFNLRAADRLGLTLPPAVLAQATDVLR